MGRRKTGDAKNMTVAVRVSPTIAADYAKRGAFPALRPDCPYRAVTYHVPPGVAAEVLDDAKAQHGREDSLEDRGVKKAYRSLVDMLDTQLRPRSAPVSSATPAPAQAPGPSSAHPRSVREFLLAGKCPFTAAIAPGPKLHIEDFSPRCWFYTGTKAQLQAAGVLPKGFIFAMVKLYEEAWGGGWRGDVGDLSYHVDLRPLSQAQRSSKKKTAPDHVWWEVRVFDNRYRFEDHLKRLAA